MPALLTALLACAAPARFPSPELVGRGLPDSFTWYTDPAGRFEVALPGFPSVGQGAGEVELLEARLPGATFTVSLSAEVRSQDPPGAVVARAGESRLASLGVKARRELPWSGLPEGRAFPFDGGELRVGLLDHALLSLLGRGGGDADDAFLDSFSTEPMAPTRVGLPGTSRRIRCPARCGPTPFRVVLPHRLVETDGIAAMIGEVRVRAVALPFDGDARDAILRGLLGDAVRVGEQDGVLRYRAGRDTVLVRVIEAEGEWAAASVSAAEPPPWAVDVLRSLE